MQRTINLMHPSVVTVELVVAYRNESIFNKTHSESEHVWCWWHSDCTAGCASISDMCEGFFSPAEYPDWYWSNLASYLRHIGVYLPRFKAAGLTNCIAVTFHPHMLN